MDNKPIAADRLRSFIERIERLAEEVAAIKGDIKDVFTEAKAVGYDVKTMRKVVRLRAMDPADRAEQEALLDTYLHALGMVDRIEARLDAGESLRAAARAEGTSKSTAHRVSQKRAAEVNRENGTTPDAEPVARVAPPPADDRTFDDIAGEMPARLRRTA